MNKLLNSQRAQPLLPPTPYRKPEPGRILVVDDKIGIRQLGTDVLIEHGYQVDAAEDDTAGWEALQAGTYDLLITDLDMPGFGGVKLVKRLRAAHMELPVILASGIMTPQELNRSSWLQTSGALLKPFSPYELLLAVQEVLRAPA